MLTFPPLIHPGTFTIFQVAQSGHWYAKQTFLISALFRVKDVYRAWSFTWVSVKGLFWLHTGIGVHATSPHLEPPRSHSAACGSSAGHVPLSRCSEGACLQPHGDVFIVPLFEPETGPIHSPTAVGICACTTTPFSMSREDKQATVPHGPQLQTGASWRAMHASCGHAKACNVTETTPNGALQTEQAGLRCLHWTLGGILAAPMCSKATNYKFHSKIMLQHSKHETNLSWTKPKYGGATLVPKMMETLPIILGQGMVCIGP